VERCLLESLALKYRYVIEVGASGGGRDGVPVDHGVLRGPACDFQRSERHLPHQFGAGHGSPLYRGPVRDEHGWARGDLQAAHALVCGALCRTHDRVLSGGQGFHGVEGIAPEGHLTDINPLEAEVKRTMIRQAARPVLLADGRKVEQRGFSVVGHLSEVSMTITAGSQQSYVDALVERGVDVQNV
jgi:hypothetical protein